MLGWETRRTKKLIDHSTPKLHAAFRFWTCDCAIMRCAHTARFLGEGQGFRFEAAPVARRRGACSLCVLDGDGRAKKRYPFLIGVRHSISRGKATGRKRGDGRPEEMVGMYISAKEEKVVGPRRKIRSIERRELDRVASGAG